MKASTYWMRNTRIEGESMQDFKAELDKLTDQDKQDLVNWSIDEMNAKGLDITTS